jgi:NAD(P)-dependent dehydrogenase (short-subunit alcohol dehydrogenase family)
VISGRTEASVGQAVEKLAARHDADHVWGHPCDVQRMEQVQSLWDAAVARLGAVDIWINNAGITNPRLDLWAYSAPQIDAVIDTNLLGTMYGSNVALRGMLEQGHGSLYNMEGLGSDGRKVRHMLLYGTTKCAVRYFTEALVEETRGTPVQVGTLSPGMVVTDLLVGPHARNAESWARNVRVLNILADRVETVTPWLARRVLANDRHGVRFAWLTGGKVLLRFLTAPFCKRSLVE